MNKYKDILDWLHDNHYGVFVETDIARPRQSVNGAIAS